MALAKKGSRTITVDETLYRWLVSAQDEGGLGLVVELAALPAQRMVTWFTHGDIISPSVVEWAIKSALAQGWNPEKSGREIQFSLVGDLGTQFVRIVRQGE